MEWWSTSPLGGDEPLDILNDVERALGLPTGSLYPMSAIRPDVMRAARASIEADFDKIEGVIAERARAYRDGVLQEGAKRRKKGGDENIPVQVAAAAVMAVGARMPAFFQMRAIGAAKNDRWARADRERRVDMDAFVQQLRHYRAGTPTPVVDDDMVGMMASRLRARKAREHDAGGVQ